MKKKLLLADDSVTIQKVVQITFSHDDYELTVVDNGEIAYEKARQQRPDLILADVFMPGKNGYELCAAVKNDPALSTVPVLLLTGTFEPFDEAKARSVGADRWIAKPFESQALIASVEELLASAAQAPVASPLPLTTPVAPTAPPVPSTEIPEDIWGSDLVVESPAVHGEPMASDAFAAPSQDDLWDVSGFESDASADLPAASSDDLWGSFEAPASSADVKSAVSVVAPSAEDLDPWGNDDFSTAFAAEEISPAAGPLPADGDEFLPTGDIEVLEEIDLLEPAAEPLPGLESTDVFATCDFSFDEPAPQAAAVTTPVAPPFPAPVVVPQPSVDIVQKEVAVPLPTGAPVQGATLSNDQLELIVERVAEVVVSRLAGTLLEKIAWEVVPDLAETMIKEELRKIRESVSVD